MKNKFLVLLTLLLAFSMVLAACTPAAPTEEPAAEEPAVEEPVEEATEEPVEEATEEPVEEETEEPTEEPTEEEAAPAGEVIEGFKAGMVTDVGGVDDRSFSETTWNGLRQAGEDLGIDVTVLESQAQTDYATNRSEERRVGKEGRRRGSAENGS